MYNKWLNHVVILIIVYVIAINNSESKVIGNNDQLEELEPSNGLYNASDDVVVLNSTNLKSTISNGKTAWFVEFYNSWCGHCLRFAPTWKTFAKSVIGWNDIVTVAAIDCSNYDNNPLCRDYEIMKYPTIKYFSIGDRGIGVEVVRNLTDEGVMQGIIEKLQKDQQDGKGGNWPNIAPYRSNNSEDWEKALRASSVKYHILLFEENNSFLGTQVILDLHTLKNLLIRRVTRDNAPLYGAYGITKFPSLMVFDRDNKTLQVKLRLPEPSREGVNKVIKDFMKSKGLISEPNRPTTPDVLVSIDVNKAQPEIKYSGSKAPVKDVLYQADLENALRYSLEQEIPLKKIIKGEQLEALKDYLKVISKYFPLKRGNPGYLSKLYEIVSERPSITGENFKGLVMLHQQETVPVFTENREWIGCRGSSPQFRKYPCGLWTLFHTLTVNHAESFEDEEIGSRSVGMVLKAMYGYIKNFFGCGECAEHFVKMARDKDLFNVETVDNTILWLWRAHNEVNQRLSGDPTEDPEFPKVQYPRAEHCGNCRHSDGSWNAREVLNYLKGKYGFSGIHYGMRDGAREEEVVRPRREPLAAHRYINAQRKIGWDFTFFDISILVVLYVASAAILVLVCVQFAVKKSMRRKMFIHSLLGKV